MYWTKWQGESINRANLDGSNVEEVLATGSYWPWAIALDLDAAKMYWTIGGSIPRVRRANMDGSNVEDAVINLLRPQGITLDLHAGKVYWTEGPLLQTLLRRANLDGSNIEDLGVEGNTAPDGINIDSDAGKVDGTDWGRGKIPAPQ